MKSHFVGGFDHRIACLVLAVCTVLVYVSTFSFGFVSDDHPQIEHAASSASPLREAFTRPVAQNYYRPLFRLYVMALTAVADARPPLWHVFSVSMHTLVVLLAYWFCLTIGLEPPWAFLVALIMGIHPVHVESVAWISGVSDPLYSLSFLLALIGYVLYRRQGKPVQWVLTLLAATTALLSKETAVMLAPALVLLELTVLRTVDGRRRGLPVIGAVAALELVYLAVRQSVLHAFSHHWNGMTFTQMVLTWPQLLLLYIRHLVWPTGLSFYYDIEPVSHLSDVAFYGSAAGLLLVLAVLVYVFRTGSDWVRFSLFWTPLLLAPALYLRIYNFGEFAHDRYLYLPLLGFAILVALLVAKLPPSERTLLGYSPPQFLVVAILVTALATAAYAQSLYYRSDLLLYYRAVNLQPNSDQALNNLGVQLFDRGMLPEALGYYGRAAGRNDRSWVIEYNFAMALERAGDLQQADAHYRRAAAFNPYSEMVWLQYASLVANQGDTGRTEQILEQARESLPQSTNILLNLAAIDARQGETDKALVYYRRVLQLDPQNRYAREGIARIAGSGAGK